MIAALSLSSAQAQEAAVASHPTASSADGAGVDAAAESASSATAAGTDTAGNSASILETVVVTGTRQSAVTREVSTGILGARSILETPFSVNAVTASEIKNLQVKDINGVFRYDASVTQSNSGIAQASGAQFNVRGVIVDHLLGYKVDGYAVPYWSIDFPVEHFESIQLIKGATGFMYGFGSPGGIVNFATKRPTDTLYFSADVGVRTKDLINRHIDVGGPVTDWLGFRFNAVQETGDTYNGGHNDNRSFSLNLDVKPTDKLLISLDSFFLKTIQKDQINTFSVSATAPVTHLEPIDPKFPIGAKGSWKTNKMYTLAARADYEINDTWRFSAGYRYNHLDENFPGNLLSIVNNRGDATHSAFFVRRVFDFRQFQANVTGSFDTGPLSHDVIIGIDDKIIDFWGDLSSSPQVPLGTINIYTGPAPTLALYPASRYNPRLYLQNKYRERSAFLIDTIKWNDWELLVGGRFTKYTNIARSLQNVVTAIYDEDIASPTVALSYTVAPSTRIYGSYTEGFENGGAPPATAANFGETFPSIDSKQKELGIKTQQSSWTATAALFRTDRGAGYVNGRNIYVQDGSIRYQGVEATANWRPLPGLSLGASYRYQTSKYRRTAAAQVGKDVPGNPRNQAVIYGSYFLPNLPDLNLNAQVRYQDGVYVNPNNLLRLPSVTTLDVGAGYRFQVDGHDVAIRASVKNITNEKYWNISSSLSAGDPRSFQITAEFIF